MKKAKARQVTQSRPHYHLCPRCGRATPASAKEKFCPNDGTKLLTACPHCGADIHSPYSRFCSSCGEKLLENTPTTQPLMNSRSGRKKG